MHLMHRRQESLSQALKDAGSHEKESPAESAEKTTLLNLGRGPELMSFIEMLAWFDDI